MSLTPFLRSTRALATSSTLAVLSTIYSTASAASTGNHDDHDHRHLETLEVYGQTIPARLTEINMSNVAPGRETGDSLRDLLGLSGSRMGGHGIDPSIRGLSQTQLNVLLDGAYVHGGCPNRMDPPTSYAAAGAFEDVTVIRGVQTLAYGSGGPGGTILFERETQPFTEDEFLRGKVTAAYRGNSHTSDLNGDMALGNALGYIRLMANTADSGNYRDGSGQVVRAAYEARGGNLLLGLTPTTGRLIELSYDRQDTENALYPGAGMDSPDARNTTVRLRVEWAALGLLRDVNVELYQSEVAHVMDNYSLRPNMGMKMRAPSTSDTTGGRLTAELSSDWGLATFGIDGQYNRRAAYRFSDNLETPRLNSVLWPQVDIDQTGVFAELGHPLTSEIWVLGGVRYDHVRSRAQQSSVEPAGMAMSPEQLYARYYGETVEPRQRDHNVGALLRVEYSPANRDTLWYAGVSRSLRTPDATERYIASNGMTPSDRWVGNPSIDPETHHQFEIGVVRQWHAARLDASLYVNNISDYILRDRYLEPEDHATIYRNVDARLMGGEVQLDWMVSKNLSLEIGAAYVHADNTTDDRALAQTPPLEGYAALTWTHAHGIVGANFQAAATQTRVDLTSLTGVAGQGLDVRQTPGWGVLNLFSRYHISEQWLLEAGVDNLLDKGYTQHLNRGNAFDPSQIQVNEPGRSAWISMTVSL